MKFLVSIDPGSVKCGIAIFDAATRSLIDYKLVKASGNKYIDRVVKIANEVDEFIISVCNNNKFYLVSELYMFNTFKSNGAIVVPITIGAIIKMLYDRILNDIIFIAPNTVKYIVTGDGRADKNKVIKCISSHYKIDDTKAERHDVYDAIAIGYSAIIKYFP